MRFFSPSQRTAIRMTAMTFFLGLIFLRILAIVCSGNRAAYLEKFCKTQIDPAYEIHVPPKNEDEPGHPLMVFVKFKVIDIDEIDGAHMDFRLHMYLKLFWRDPRLKRNSSMSTDCSSYIWTPDIQFLTAKRTQAFDTASAAFLIENSGLIIKTNRYSFKASCIMNFEHYPFDTQQCIFTVVFMNTHDDIAQLKWLGEKSSPVAGQSIEFTREIEPLQYYAELPSTHSITNQMTYANYTYLVANFTLQRRLTGSVINIYLPSTLVVAVSWVTFWLRPEAAPARVSLSITSLLTLCTQVQQYKAQLPSVNYITAMDIWLFVCIFVVFSTLLEFAVCYNAHITCKEEQTSKVLKTKVIELSKSTSSFQEARVSSSWSESNKEDATIVKRVNAVLFGENETKWCTLSSCLKDSLKMDSFCRKYFPLSFLVFSVLYWLYFLSV